MIGEATTSIVAMLTLAAKATGNIPKPALLGASSPPPKETKYKIATNKETPNETKDKGRRNSSLL